MAFVCVESLRSLWSGEMRRVEVGGRAILLVHVAEGVRAYEDRCVHQGVALSKGRLSGNTLTCSAHDWEYDARCGRGINPGSTQIRRYAVRVVDDEVCVDPDLLEAERKGPGADGA